jgi:signal transduction histidine kinase
VLSVTDRGAGIAPEAAERIFAAGYTTKRDENGGLGLSTVRNLAVSHGGGVDVESTPGAGTTMAVYLAAADQPAWAVGGGAAAAGSA